MMSVFLEQTSGATIENVGLLNVNITGQNNVGGLVGYSNNSSSISNSFATGNVSGIIMSAALLVIMIIQAVSPTAMPQAV